MYDLQKANMWKRMSAALFDCILLAIVVLGFALLLTTVLGFDGYMEQKNALDAKYMAEYGLDPDLTMEELNAFTDAEKESYQAAVNAANEAIRQDPELSRVLGMLLSLAMLITTFSILGAPGIPGAPVAEKRSDPGQKDLWCCRHAGGRCPPFSHAALCPHGIGQVHRGYHDPGFRGDPYDLRPHGLFGGRAGGRIDADPGDPVLRQPESHPHSRQAGPNGGRGYGVPNDL